MEKNKSLENKQIDSAKEKKFHCGGMEIKQIQNNIPMNQSKSLPSKTVNRETNLDLIRQYTNQPISQKDRIEKKYGPFEILDMPKDMNGYLNMQIGKHVMAHFIAGGSNVFEVEGILRNIGRNYIVIEDIHNGDKITCDFYSLRFIRIYGQE